MAGWSRSLHSSSGSHMAALRGYYEVLGVPNSATDQEVKKAYYQLAKLHHPDTNTTNPDAAAIFQEVQKAYETLRDPEKRRMYDQVGREGMERMESGGSSEAPGGGFRGGGFPFGNMGPDIFEQLFNQDPLMNMFNRMMVQPIRVTFMEAVTGTRRRVTLSGIAGGDEGVDVDIPAGVDTGDQVEVQVQMPGRGRGRGMTTARIAIPIEVEPHPTLTRQGADVHCATQVPLAQALLGTKTLVDSVGGPVELQVPACSQNGDRLRMRGKGIFNPRRGVHGDQYVEIRVAVPRALNARQRELLMEFAQEEEYKKTGRRPAAKAAPAAPRPPAPSASPPPPQSTAQSAARTPAERPSAPADVGSGGSDTELSWMERGRLLLNALLGTQKGDGSARG